MEIKESVIRPTYNRDELLKRALDSVPLSKEYQIIVIDDGSEDGTWKYVSHNTPQFSPVVDNPKYTKDI